MATKNELTNLINANIRNKTPKVLKVQHADVEQAIVEDAYFKVYDSSDSLTYTTVDSITGLSWSLVIGKSHGMINIYGTIQTLGNSIAEGEFIFNWKPMLGVLPNPMRPFSDFYVLLYRFDNDFVYKMNMSQIGLMAVSPLPGNDDFFFNITYPSQY